MKTKILTVLMLLATVVMGASAETFTEAGINYNTLSYNTVSVTAGTYTGAVTVPQKVIHSGKSYTITEIGDSAFFKCSNVTAVNIPQSVTRLGLRSFAYSGITQITIP